MAGIEVQVRLKPVPTSTWNASDTIIFRNDLRFVFNHIHGTTTTNAKLYGSIEPFVTATFGGQNVTVMAYGQTGSGKTHTMLGSDFDKGFIPRAAESLIALAKAEPGATIRGSCIEIYNDSLRDLLNVDRMISLTETTNGVNVDRSWLPMRTPADFVILSTRAENNRRYGETDMNEHSSRSHTILAFEVIREHCRAIINFVDLAGSECTAKSNTAGQQLREGNFINKSLLALGNVVDAIVEGRSHIPYRECKLTRVLRPCLGGKSLAYILTCVNTSSENVTETTAALRFAQRAMKIKNDPTLTLTAPPLVAHTLHGHVSAFAAASSEAENAAFARGIQDTYTYCIPGVEQIVGAADREAQSLKDDFLCLQLAAFAAEKKRGLDRLAEAQDTAHAHSQTLSEALQLHETELKRLRDKERSFAESEAKLARSEHDSSGFARSLERREEAIRRELGDLQDELITPCLQLELFELNARLSIEMEERQIYVAVIEDFAEAFQVDPVFDDLSSLQLITQFRDEIRNRRSEVDELEDAAALYYSGLPSSAIVQVPAVCIDVEERVFQLQTQERKLDTGIKDALRSTSRSQKSAVPTRKRQPPVSPSPSPVSTAAASRSRVAAVPGFMSHTLRTIRSVVSNITSPLKSPSVRTPVRRAGGRFYDAENSESVDEAVGIATRRRLLAEQEERKRAAEHSKSPSLARRNVRQR